LNILDCTLRITEKHFIMEKKLLPYLVILSALSVSASAMFYSVTGLGKMFAGASTEVMVMVASLEVAKLVVASLVYQYWSQLSVLLRVYYITAVLVLMMITSGGIYGYLSAAYVETSSKMKIEDSEVVMIENRKSQKELELSFISKEMEYNEKRRVELNELRERQESRMDTLINRGQNTSANRVRGDIASLKKEQEELADKSKELNKLRLSIGDSLAYYDREVLQIRSNSEVSGDIGPLKYIAELTGRTIDQVVNWFIMALIFVFDPLAVSLVLGANIIFSKKTPVDMGEVQNPDDSPMMLVADDETANRIEVLENEVRKKENRIIELESRVKKLTQDNDMLRDLTYDTSSRQSEFQENMRKLREEKELLETEKKDLERLKEEIETWEKTHWKMRRGVKPPSAV